MSSTQSKNLFFNYHERSTYLSASGSASLSDSGKNCGIVSGSNLTGYLDLNSAAKNTLFPNSGALTTRVKVAFWHYSNISNASNYTHLDIDGATRATASSSTAKAVSYDANINISKDSQFRITLHTKSRGLFESTSWVAIGGDEGIDITLYFTRYDFSASTSTGIASASVSSTTGYDGDTITFTASLQSGYTFDGWYSGSTKVSSSQTYVHTVAGADMALTAKAIASTKTVTTKYGNTTIATEQRMPPVAVSYGSTQIVSVSSGQTKTLNCLNNLMSSNLTVGGKTLLCANQIMNGNIIVSVS